MTFYDAFVDELSKIALVAPTGLPGPAGVTSTKIKPSLPKPKMPAPPMTQPMKASKPPGLPGVSSVRM